MKELLRFGVIVSLGWIFGVSLIFFLNTAVWFGVVASFAVQIAYLVPWAIEQLRDDVPKEGP